MVFFSLVPFSFLLALYFLFNPTPIFSATLNVPPPFPFPTITFFHPQPLLSRSPCSDFGLTLLIRYHGRVFAASFLRDFSRTSMKIGRASAWVLAPPPSMFDSMGLLTPCVLGFHPDLFSKWWLQILCYCANFFYGVIDDSVVRCCVPSSSYFFRVILYGLWFTDFSDSCDFGVSCLNSVVAVTVPTIMVPSDCTEFVAATEEEKIRARVCFWFFCFGWASICLVGFYLCIFYFLLGLFWACNFIFKKPNELILFEIGLCTYLGKSNKCIDQSQTILIY